MTGRILGSTCVAAMLAVTVTAAQGSSQGPTQAPAQGNPLQRPIERAQMQKLLATGRTDLFTRFISKKGRPFKAYLAKTTEGKVGFEFEARAPRKTPAAQ